MSDQDGNSTVDQDGNSTVASVSNTSKKKRGRPKKEKGRVSGRYYSRKSSRKRSKIPSIVAADAPVDDVEYPPLQPRPTRAGAPVHPVAAAAADVDDDEEYNPQDSPSKNTRSQTRNQVVSPNNDDDDADVDEEIFLDRLEQYCQGIKEPPGQLYRKQDSRGRTLFTKDEHRQRRMAIHYYYTTIYGSPPEDTGLWGGKDGIAVRIRNSLMLKKTQSSTNNVMKTLRSISMCNAMNKPYYGERDQHKPYEKYYIKTTDFEAQLIADLIEAGIGFTETTDKVNEWRRANGRKLPNGQTDVGRSCVYLTSKRLLPKVTVIMKRPQGSLNKESNWCKASHRWACQMLIMLGELKKDSEIPKKFYISEGGFFTSRLPDCFRISMIKKVDIKCCVYGDESHKKTRKGSVRGGTKIEHRYPRDEFGTLDFSDYD